MSQRERDMAPINDPWGQQEEAGRSTQSGLDQAKRRAAVGLHRAAEAIHRQSDRSSTGSEVGRYGHRTAEFLDQAADYIGEKDVQQMRADLEEQVRRHPGRSLLIAGGIGLLLGAVFRRR